MQKLTNAVQNYAWGSHIALTELYGIANPDNLLMAELRMGAHPGSSLQILAADGQPRSLREVVDADKAALPGDKVAAHFGELPFLFKVLCVAQPFSIQVYLSRQASEESFARESAAGIPLSAAERNYKDPNHELELVFALTPFLAMNASRELSEIVILSQLVVSAHPAIGTSPQQPDATHLSQLFASLLNTQGEEEARALQVLRDVLAREQDESWQAIYLIVEFYLGDSGLSSSLLSNVVRLNPGEAMFPFAETPRTYLQGVALEVIANSDNALRASPTSKYIDTPELIANAKFEIKPTDELLTQPQQHGTELSFPILVEDFVPSLHDLPTKASDLAQASATIILCVDDETVLYKGDQSLTPKPGESAFVAASESPVQVSGRGHVVHVFNKLQ